MNIVLTASFKNGLFLNGLTQNIVFLAELINDIGYNAIICINHELNEGQDVPQDLDLIYEKDLHELENVTAIFPVTLTPNGVNPNMFKNQMKKKTVSK